MRNKEMPVFTLAKILKPCKTSPKDRVDTKQTSIVFPRPLWERARVRGLKKCAFTLAEVLITLGIIGVVAALTIPTLINSYQEKATITALKKFYSVASQACLLAKVENGEINTN